MWILRLFTRKGRFRFRRYRHIVSTLVGHGFGELVYQTGVGKLMRLFRRPLGRRKRKGGKLREETSTWVRIRMTIEELGPTFIKLGQILSNRPDLIPKELQDELEKLQEHVPPISTKAATSVVESELGEPVTAIFAEFDPEPLAAASIAQVHRATLKSGEKVVVKIQRPGLEELVSVDVEILRDLATLLERYVPESRQISPNKLVDEFESGIRQELNFLREAASVERFGLQFAEEKRIKVPLIYWDYSSQRVLTMEYIDGERLSDLLNAGEREEEKSKVAKLGAELTLKQIFAYGFFHADPHPGNLVVLDDGRLCYLDFGLTGSLIVRDLEVISDILINIIGRNEQKAARAVIRLAGSRDIERAKRIERHIAEIIERFQSSGAGDFSFTALLTELVKVLVGEGLSLPPDLFLLVKSLLTIEGIATSLDPDLNFTAQVEPIVATLVRDRYSSKRIKRDLANSAGDYAELLQNLPADYFRMVDAVASGKLRVSLDEGNVDRMRQTVLQAVSSLVFALVLASLVIGSALIVQSGVPPLWHEVPVIGIVGFLTAGVIGFWLLVKIVRSGSL